MRDLIKLLIILSPMSAWANPPPNHYWQCHTNDINNHSWLAKNTYQKIALNLAYATCKRESTAPLSCKTSINNCEEFHNGVSVKILWQCTALDQAGERWRSTQYATSEDAALAAKDYCKDQSTVPDTCYINMINCTQSN